MAAGEPEHLDLLYHLPSSCSLLKFMLMGLVSTE